MFIFTLFGTIHFFQTFDPNSHQKMHTLVKMRSRVAFFPRPLGNFHKEESTKHLKRATSGRRQLKVEILKTMLYHQVHYSINLGKQNCPTKR